MALFRVGLLAAAVSGYDNRRQCGCTEYRAGASRHDCTLCARREYIEVPQDGNNPEAGTRQVVKAVFCNPLDLGGSCPGDMDDCGDLSACNPP
eukprot:2895727-Prymnesium_polylepis.1